MTIKRNGKSIYSFKKLYKDATKQNQFTEILEVPFRTIEI